MRELSQIRDAVVSALAAEGMAALDAYPDQRARRYGCPVAAVLVFSISTIAPTMLNTVVTRNTAITIHISVMRFCLLCTFADIGTRLR